MVGHSVRRRLPSGLTAALHPDRPRRAVRALLRTVNQGQQLPLSAVLQLVARQREDIAADVTWLGLTIKGS